VDLQERLEGVTLGGAGPAALVVRLDFLSFAAGGCGDWIMGTGGWDSGEDARIDSVGGEDTAAEVAGEEGVVELAKDRGGPLAQADFGAIVEEGLSW
jgi:hypothetical protein